MAKLKNALVVQYEEERRQQDRQKQIKEDLGIENENAIVIEKGYKGINYIKTIARILAKIIKVICSITISIFACIGVLVLIYPNTRTELLAVINQIVNEVQHFIS